MRHSCKKLAVSFLVGILLLNKIAGVAFAASGGQVTLPAAPPPGVTPRNPSGLKLSIDTTWLPANGYRPVRITIKPIAPVASDRTLQIRLTPIGEVTWMRTAGIQVSQSIDIPAGSASQTMTISVPQWEGWRSLRLDVSEDGKRINELSANDVFVSNEIPIGSNPYSNSLALGRFPALLLLGISANDANTLNSLKAPSLAGSFRLYSSLVEDSKGIDLTANGTTPPAPEITPRINSIAGLPDRWLDYSGIDIVLLPLDKLKDVVKNHPALWTAIRRMVAAGGNLWVYDVGDQWQRIAELEELADLGASAAANADPAQSPASRGWEQPKAKPAGGQLIVDSNDASAEILSSLVPGNANAADSPQAPDYMIHGLGRGQLVAIAASAPLADGTFDFPSLLNTIGRGRWQWAARQGVELDPSNLGANNENFWQFLIPGVGLTPVLQFQILISLFVIGIGPVNYLLLKRWQKLNLLPITVGVSAAAVTLALFAYAFIHDGIGVRVRARSFTELDQRRGEAVCWSRLSYYAGLSPSRGLNFPGDVAVYPMRIGTGRITMNREGPPPQEMEWIPADPNVADALPSQHFSSDWLPARVPTQFVTVESRKTAARLNVSQSGQQGGVSKIENRLGARIRWLLLTDAAGECFEAEDVNDESSVAVAPIETGAAFERITRIVLDNELQLPPGAQSSWFQNNSGFSRRVIWNGSSNEMPVPAASDTILEQGLHHLSHLNPRSFIAVMESSPEVELGTPSAREESSLHVLVGKW